MHIQFLGASGTVTGSCYLLTTDSHKRILIDLGMFQGGGTVEDFNQQTLPFDVHALHAVVITHAHLDHCGRLPLLIKAGYAGRIYMTEATKLLVGIALFDAVKVANNHHERKALYSEEDVQNTLKIIQTIGYAESAVFGTLRITLRNAGHILGSASLEVSEEGRRILFSGDLGNPQQKLLQPTEHIPTADTVIMESTYGDRMHPQEDVFTTIQKEINTIENSGGVLLIPAFALDRTQVLLHTINHLKKDGKVRKSTPIFLDSPMGIKATQIYRESKDFWSDELRSHTDDPFSFEELILTEEAAQSEKILKISGPKVIIAGNGMMSGGRIWHHLINYLPLVSTRLLIVGYQGEETLGREILNGQKQVAIYHEAVVVNATVSQAQGLSAHADQPQLMRWLQSIQGVQSLFLTHGEETARMALSEKMRITNTIPTIILPQKDAVFEI